MVLLEKQSTGPSHFAAQIWFPDILIFEVEATDAGECATRDGKGSGGALIR